MGTSARRERRSPALTRRWGQILMQTIEIGGKSIPFSEKGFLHNFNDWSENLAQAMADGDNLTLGECHWAAIRFMREYFSTYGVNPSARTMIKEVGSKLSPYKCTRRTLEELFPNGGCKHACRLAGLPDYFCHGC
jgi:TusE/DsrC/DsvC family sulfur relay protein